MHQNAQAIGVYLSSLDTRNTFQEMLKEKMKQNSNPIVLIIATGKKALFYPMKNFYEDHRSVIEIL